MSAPDSKACKSRVWIVAVVWSLRLIVGSLFAMSGFVKMIDPWGFLFKLEEYLAVWHLTQPRTVVLIAVLCISGYEFVMGSLLALGCYKRVAPWGLTLMMAVMLPLTLYIWIANPVSDCGCFGDFWVISNAATFWKNVFITAALILLICWNSRIGQSVFQPAIQWMVGAWITLYIIFIGLYGYNVQPLLDFRSFPIGKSLLPPDEVEEDVSGEYIFTYEKDGESSDFTIDNLPDSTWEFVSRRLDRAASSSQAVHESYFSIFDSYDDDVTADVIPSEGPMILLVIPEPLRADVSYTFTINEMWEYADSVGIPMAALIGGSRKTADRWTDLAMAEYPVYTVEDTELKELSRGSMSVVTLTDGKVVSKNSLMTIDPDVIEFPPSQEAFMSELEGKTDGVLMRLTLIFVGALVLLALTQSAIIEARKRMIKRREKKRKNKEA